MKFFIGKTYTYYLYKFKKNCTNLILKLAGMGKNVNSSASG